MTVRSMQALAALAAAISLTACASVPLSTMWKMRGMTADTFFTKDPRALRVALRSDDRVKPGTPAIDIRIEGMSKQPICYAFALTPIDRAAAGEAPLDPLSGHRRWFAFGLSKEGIAAFDRARREVRVGKLDAGSFSLNVSMDGMDFPEDFRSLPFGIDLLIDRKDGYFTLIEETDITVNRSAKAEPAKPVVPATPTKDAKTEAACGSAA